MKWDEKGEVKGDMKWDEKGEVKGGMKWERIMFIAVKT